MRDGDYVDGKKHGLWISYFADGTKTSEGHYVHGQKAWAMDALPPERPQEERGHVRERQVCRPLHLLPRERPSPLAGPLQRDHGHIGGRDEGRRVAGLREDGETVKRRMTYRRGSKMKPDEYAPFDDQ